MRIFQHYDAEVAEAVCVNVLINVSIMQQFGRRRRRLLCVELIPIAPGQQQNEKQTA